MLASLTLLQLTLLSLVSGSPVARSRLQPRTSEIQWGPCSNYNFTSPLECGSLTVPLDYTEPEIGTIDLEILRLRSGSDTPRGSVFFNFGGPGENGREPLDKLAPILQPLTGGCYDLITIVPRGTNNTLFFDCYGSDEIRAASSPIPLNGNASDVAIDQLWAESTLFASSCYVRQNETGRFVGTAFTARDHKSVLDALGGDGLFRFWGISYGTILGATYAAMFPDTVDRMVLDGVVNAHQYYTNTETEIFSDADKVFEEMLTACAAAPETCELAHNQTASELIESTYTFIEGLKYDPIPLTLATGDGFLVTYSLVRNFLQGALYTPSQWAGITKVFNDVQTGNVTGILDFLSTQTPALQAESQFGIKCGDVLGDGQSKDEILPTLLGRHESSRAIGDSADVIVTRCAQWPFHAKERYSGNFQVRTRTPPLFIGNTGDPVTPLVSAKIMSVGFEGSAVLEHGGYGHALVGAQASSCTAEAVRAYFADGTLPQNGTLCEAEPRPFGASGGWAELLAEMPAAQCPSS